MPTGIATVGGGLSPLCGFRRTRERHVAAADTLWSLLIAAIVVPFVVVYWWCIFPVNALGFMLLILLIEEQLRLHLH